MLPLFCLACPSSSPPAASDPPPAATRPGPQARTPSPDPATTSMQNPDQDPCTEIETAWRQIKGFPYVWGAESKAEGGFDCSGAVYHVQKTIGHPVPRTTAAKYWILAAGKKTSWENATCGSWIWWAFTARRPHGHIGMQTSQPYAWESGSHTGPARIKLAPGGYWDRFFAGSKQPF